MLEDAAFEGMDVVASWPADCWAKDKFAMRAKIKKTLITDVNPLAGECRIASSERKDSAFRGPYLKQRLLRSYCLIA